MSRIYTRTGDGGTTSLADGARVLKSAPRVEAYGAIDEANAWIGAARAFVEDPDLDAALELLQHRFYNCSSNVAAPAGSAVAPPTIGAEDIASVERAIDLFEERTGAISGFVLPGGCRAAAMLHVARTVCRRAERILWSLAESEEVDRDVLGFVNRSSDMLFAAARLANAIDGGGDVLWDEGLPLPRIGLDPGEGDPGEAP